jgi:intracellular multiplication protein IcmG
MSEQKNKGDEEYHYPNEEYVVEPDKKEETSPEIEAPEKPESPVVRFLVKNKRVVLVVMLVIIALIAFQIINHKKSTKPKPAPSKVVQQQSKPNAVSLQNFELQQSLASIRESNADKNSQISALQSEIQTMQAQMAESNKTNGELKQAMVLLLQQLNNLNEQLHQNSKALKPSGPPKPKLIYYIRAMIDGRAWLIGSNGLTESVTVGDPVPGYGIVKSIDPVENAITTSSGKIIHLGLNDF